jgi:hypothetical protein
LDIKVDIGSKIDGAINQQMRKAVSLVTQRKKNAVAEVEAERSVIDEDNMRW